MFRTQTIHPRHLKVALFLQEQRDMIFYTAEDSHGGTMLCAATPNLTNQLRQTLWRQQKPMILTSGTLAVGEDFHRFKEASGLLTDSRAWESVSPSPFAYSKQPAVCFPSAHLSGCRTILRQPDGGDRRPDGCGPWSCPGAVYILCRHVCGEGTPAGEGAGLSAVHSGA